MKKTTVLQQLRTAGLRPTVARIGILQVLGASAPQAICAETVFHSMRQRGIQTSMGTIYRGIHLLQEHGLVLRAWSEERKALYRLKPAEQAAQPLRLVCCASGKSVLLYDERLHQYLADMAEREGLDTTHQQWAIHLNRLDHASSARPASAPSI